MEIQIQKATIEQKSILKNLLELYIYDFTEFGPYDVNADGLYGYPFLDSYWIEEGRHPFIFYVNGKIAGFVLVRCEYDGTRNEAVYSIAEFFVMKKYRRHKVGQKVAYDVFRQFPGLWEVGQMQSNTPAQMFWRRVVDDFTQGNFHEIHKTDWNGPVQVFRTDLF